MTTDEEDYSDYIKHMSNISSTTTVLAGFTFTTITLLITLLPDPSQILVQLTLLFLASLFNLYMFIVGWGSFDLLYLCRKVPPLTKQLKIFNYISLFGYSMLGAIIVLIFLLSNLIYLTLASGVIWILFIIATYTILWKPFKKFPETRARILGKVEKKEKYRD